MKHFHPILPPSHVDACNASQNEPHSNQHRSTGTRDSTMSRSTRRSRTRSHRHQQWEVGSSHSHSSFHFEHEYGYPNDYTMAQTYPEIPSSPPPPYEVENSYLRPPQPSPIYQQQYQSQPYLPQTQTRPRAVRKKKSRAAWASAVDLSTQPAQWRQEQGWQSTAHLPPPVPTSRQPQNCPIARSMNQAAALCDQLAERFNDVISRMDGNEHSEGQSLDAMIREMSLEDTRYRPLPDNVERVIQEREAEERSKTHIINIQKSWMYSNSRVLPYMLPYKVYIPTWTIFCKAARASTDVYKRPRRSERSEYVQANWRQGTKAMVLRTTPLDDQNLIVIAIRGSQWNVMDWAVNFALAPTAPVGFLDDAGNACHSGFLQVARSMVDPVAARLTEILQKDSSRSAPSILFTGHSAGGAVANLLYMHMLSRTVDSRLTNLRGVFHRIHCVTFGVPPISLLPLQKPNRSSNEKNIFVSFVNEGDPIVRADIHYMSSLFKLYTSSAPKTPGVSTGHGLRQKASRAYLRKEASTSTLNVRPPRWPVPDATLSNAGRMVLLRHKPADEKNVEAVCVSDDQLRDVVFGDPVMHHMDVYRTRIESIGVGELTGRRNG